MTLLGHAVVGTDMRACSSSHVDFEAFACENTIIASQWESTMQTRLVAMMTARERALSGQGCGPFRIMWGSDMVRLPDDGDGLPRQYRMQTGCRTSGAHHSGPIAHAGVHVCAPE